MNVDELKKQVQESENDGFDWAYAGKVYRVPYFGASSPDSLVKMADRVDEGALGGTPSEIRDFMSDFCFNLLSELNEVTKEETDKLANIRTLRELYSLWQGE